ncbi:acetate uptake transporter [archaeon]|nr:acetate uptake transporter [archaeon]
MTENSSVAEPAAFGLLGLAIITLLVGIYQIGLMANCVLILPWALVLGGGAQLFAGFMDFKRKNIFGATAFSAYGVFWIAIAITWTIEILATNATFVEGLAFDGTTIGWVALGWLIFTLYMTYGSMFITKVLAIIFVLIDLVFIALFVHVFAGVPLVVPGIAHLLLSAVAFYGSAAVVLNNQLGKTVLPVGKPFLK